MRVVFRADASVNIGTGHIMRCLALAEEMRSRGSIVEFACIPLKGNLIEIIKLAGFMCHTLLHLKDVVYSSGDWLIVDHYGIDAKWETLMRKKFRNIMVVDDLYNRAHNCDVLLDYNFHAMQKVDLYQQWVMKNIKFERLYGSQYVLLNKEFTRLRKYVKLRLIVK